MRTTKKRRYDDELAEFDPVSILNSMKTSNDECNNKKKLNKKKKKQQERSPSSGNDSSCQENEQFLNDFIYQQEEIDFEESLLLFK